MLVGAEALKITINILLSWAPCDVTSELVTKNFLSVIIKIILFKYLLFKTSIYVNMYQSYIYMHSSNHLLASTENIKPE